MHQTRKDFQWINFSRPIQTRIKNIKNGETAGCGS